MKKSFVLLTSLLLVLIVSTVSCEKKKSSGIKPDYSATGNPNPDLQTVTGTNTYTNPATQNSSILVGDIGWSNLTCISTNSLILKGEYDKTKVILTFASVATTGTYAVSSTAGQGSCAMQIINAPSQPEGIVWVAKTGSVVVNTTSVSINAVFKNVICTQASFNFPTVNATGTLSCN
jgi:hypothetical protein